MSSEPATPSAPIPDTHVAGVIEPPRGWSLPRLRELWEYRDLIYFLVRRDVSVVYKQTLIGAGWAVLRPALLAAVFSLFLGVLLDLPSEGVPYPAFVLCGMTLWLFFSSAMAKCAESTNASSALITKVYFPRLIIPVSAVLPPVVDFAVALLVLLVVLALYGIAPGFEILLLPVVLAIALTTALGIGLWLSALAARYRDVHVVVPFLVQVLLFASAVFYPLSIVPDRLQPLYSLNPVAGAMDGFRWALLQTGDGPGTVLAISALASVLLVVSGLLYFTKAEQGFADVI